MLKCPKCGYEYFITDKSEQLDALRNKRAAIIFKMHKMDAMPRREHMKDSWRAKRVALKNAAEKMSRTISELSTAIHDEKRAESRLSFRLAVETAEHYTTHDEYIKYKAAVKYDSMPMDAEKEMKNYPAK